MNRQQKKAWRIKMEKLINREQLAGMNIHYLFYSLEYFLDAQKEAGFKTIE